MHSSSSSGLVLSIFFRVSFLKPVSVIDIFTPHSDAFALISISSLSPNPYSTFEISLLDDTLLFPHLIFQRFEIPKKFYMISVFHIEIQKNAMNWIQIFHTGTFRILSSFWSRNMNSFQSFSSDIIYRNCSCYSIL